MLRIEARGPLADEQLQALESALQLQLPEPYRRLLAATNGGLTEDEPPVPGMDDPDLLLELYGDGSAGAEERADLVRVRTAQLAGDGFVGVVPADYLPIGAGHDGTLLLALDGDDAGSVWWADYERIGLLDEEADGAVRAGPDTLVRLADDVDAFLAAF